MSHRKQILILSVVILLLTAACSLNSPNSTETPTFAVATNIQGTLTPTEPPLALRVNGEGVWLAEYQASLQQFQQAQKAVGTTHTDAEARQIVINDLVNQVLLEQGAIATGYQSDPVAFQDRMETLVNQIGGQDAFQTWLQNNFYTTNSFEHSLALSIAADWKKQEIISQVPTTAEQVHARQILAYSSDNANAAYARLQSGTTFDELAFLFDPVTGGDLGWFPRGYLTQKAIEDAAFSLQPGEYSGVIQTALGFQIIEVIERDPAYPLSPDALQTLQKAAVADWLTQKKANSTVEVLVP
jgi:peptidyl-prolyl cis-trans isomerase C